jgi:hypothetical protein
MTTTTKKSKAKRVKLRACQVLLDGRRQRLVQAGEVFEFEGTHLPSPEIAIPVEADTPVGEAPPEDDKPKKPPTYTTKGFVDAANRQSGRDEDEDDSSDD